jgi:hypothetical protein
MVPASRRTSIVQPICTEARAVAGMARHVPGSRTSTTEEQACRASLTRQRNTGSGRATSAMLPPASRRRRPDAASRSAAHRDQPPEAIRERRRARRRELQHHRWHHRDSGRERRGQEHGDQDPARPDPADVRQRDRPGPGRLGEHRRSRAGRLHARTRLPADPGERRGLPHAHGGGERTAAFHRTHSRR